MIEKLRILATVFLPALSAAAAYAQSATSTPVVKIDIARSVQAVTYKAGIKTYIDFRGTELMPRAQGEARIVTDPGITKIEAKFEGIDPPTLQGPYLTYVLWAISPDGRTSNLGELVLERDEAEIETTTRLTSFALIVTAEPYFAVAFPSEAVVFENLPRKDTKGTAEPVVAQGELFKRGLYAGLKPQTIDTAGKVPAELYQARAAAEIAKAAGAETYAAESGSKAKQLLDAAETHQASKKKSDRKLASGEFRQAIQAYEDARSIAADRAVQAKLAEERKAAEQREAEAKATAEAERKAAAQREAEAKATADAESKAAAQREAEAKAAAAAEAERRAAAERGAQEAELRAAQAAQEMAAAEAERSKAAAEAEAARRSGSELRAQLLSQFNQILPTRDTPRGLVVNLGSVNFATGKSDLSSEARENLARFSGLVASYPALRFDIEGHTDSTGEPAVNEKLSQDRASNVRQYLIDKGVKPEVIAAEGLGPSTPIASNDTPEGRALNRRVEIVVSGDVIGSRLGIDPP